jgi:hypothetical protein
MSGFKIWNEACQQWEIIGVGDTLPFNLVEDTTPQLGGNLDTQGNLIIGGTAAGSLLSLKSTTANGTLTAKGVSVLVGNNGATEAITVLNNGNVGFGTTAPEAKLDVVGNIKLTPVSTSGFTAIIAAASVDVGNINGVDYNWLVTFVTSDGETILASSSNTLSVTNKKVDLSNIPVSPDNRVLSRNVYRQVSGTAAHLCKLVGNIPNNTATTFQDNVADGSLGVSVPRINTTGGILYNGVDRAFVSDGGLTAIGFQAHPNNIGYANTAIGFQTLFSNTLGSRNVGIGVYALYGNTTGLDNVAIGVHSLNYSNSSYNTAIGTSACQNNTSGTSNTAVGNSVMQLNTTGGYNTAVGCIALQILDGGTNNTAMGYSALGGLTSGHHNTAIGMQALSSNTNGWNSVAIGYQAGIYETGTAKLFIDGLYRASEALGRTTSLIYGIFDAAVANQRLTINGRLIVNQIVAALTDGAPTDTEIDTATGTTPSAAGAGFQCTIKDSSGSGLVYKVESDGTDWYYSAGMTKAVNP